ncbi:PH domain-containing protein [Actinoalloteichus caeruleus]|uniref:PH domain-containing protein n=1 Tax=Actinoalloteichus cyanogriseus TaxID=2893586 RepID=UPI003BB8D334
MTGPEGTAPGGGPTPDQPSPQGPTGPHLGPAGVGPSQQEDAISPPKDEDVDQCPFGPDAPPPPELSDPDVDEWRRLDPRIIAARPLGEAAGLLWLLVVALFVGGDNGWQLRIAGVVIVILGVNGLIRWLTTRYRITEDQVLLHTGWVFRKHLSVPRDRIRTVDLTSPLLHRVFRLVVVTVGTGHSATSPDELSLNAVTAAEAEQLRVLLLQRARAGGEAAATKGAAEGAPPDGDEVGETSPAGATPREDGEPVPPPDQLSRLRRSWLRFAPLTLAGLAAFGVLFGTSYQALEGLNVEITDSSVLAGIQEWVTALPAPVLVAVAALSFLVVMVGGALVVYVVRYWKYELSREHDGTLRVRRGLLTTRSVSIEEKRLRGVEVVEPLLLRSAKGGSADAIVTGFGALSGDRDLLLPPAPVTEAHRVAELVTRTRPAPTLTGLARHPSAARRRRLVRTVVPTLGLLGGLAWAVVEGPVPMWAGYLGLVALPLAVLLGVDRYRNLGNQLADRYLVGRRGSLVRRTFALRTDGIIGWKVRRSLFQRRAGLATVVATTAAGAGHYEIQDVDVARGLAVAEAAVPGLLTPFLTEGPRPPVEHHADDLSERDGRRN